MAEFRTERDSMGEMKVPAEAHFGASTARAAENFPISGLRLQPVFISAMGLIKWAAAEVNGAAGGVCLVSGPRPVTWAEYLGHFARMCGKPLPPSVPRWRATLEMQLLRVYGALARRPRRLQGMDVRLMSQRTAVRIDHATSLLGWTPSERLRQIAAYRSEVEPMRRFTSTSMSATA